MLPHALASQAWRIASAAAPPGAYDDDCRARREDGRDRTSSATNAEVLEYEPKVSDEGCRQHLGDAGMSGSACPDSDATIVLPTRTQLAAFVEDGFLTIFPTVPGGEELHHQVAACANRLQQTGEIGNNLLSFCPELEYILDSPEIVGGLTMLLGEDYVLQAHRHCHLVKSGSPPQEFHRDSFCGFEQFRHILPTELILFYYPQVVTLEMGPTAVLAGSQYVRGSRSGWAMEFEPTLPSGVRGEERLVSTQPGMCILMHYHLWHRATAQDPNCEGLPVRFLFKFQFRRTRPFCPSSRVREALSGANPYLNVTKAVHAPGRQHILATSWDVLSGNISPLGNAPAACCDMLPHTGHSWRMSAPPEENVKELLSPSGPYEAKLWAGHAVASLVATGAWAATEAATALAPILTDRSLGGPVYDEEYGDSDFRAQGPKWVAASALQLCMLPPGGAAASAVADYVVEDITLGATPVRTWWGDWRLEALLALAAILVPTEVLRRLVPLLRDNFPRVQYQAAVALYAAGVRGGAPDAASWSEMAAAVELDEALLGCAKQWVEFAPQAWRGDGGGRYALAEVLRCIGRFASQQAAKEALRLVGVEGRRELFEGDQWRGRFARFVERQRLCPFTSVNSPF